jgi:hypothetical protein
MSKAEKAESEKELIDQLWNEMNSETEAEREFKEFLHKALMITNAIMPIMAAFISTLTNEQSKLIRECVRYQLLRAGAQEHEIQEFISGIFQTVEKMKQYFNA